MTTRSQVKQLNLLFSFWVGTFIRFGWCFVFRFFHSKSASRFGHLYWMKIRFFWWLTIINVSLFQTVTHFKYWAQALKTYASLFHISVSWPEKQGWRAFWPNKFQNLSLNVTASENFIKWCHIHSFYTWNLI